MAKKKNEQFSDDDQDYDEPNFDDPEGFVDDATDEGVCKKKWMELLNASTAWLMWHIT